MIQDFEISITAAGGEQYSIRTEKVAKGVPHAEETVRWPVAQWLAKTQSLMHDPLLGLLQGQQKYTRTSSAQNTSAPTNVRTRTATAEASTLVHLGQSLHDSLFQGQLRESWITAQGIAQNRQTLLRLRIGMKDSRLQQLPWEALHAGTRPLATGTDVVFSRYILDRRQGHLVHIDDRKEVGQVIRILVVIASPDDQERLELRQEVEHLRSELHPSAGVESGGDALRIQLNLLEQPGRAELTQELDRGNYQVLHYAGHSDLGNAGGDLYLVSRQTGLTERLSGEDLAGLLVNNGIQLAVFNSCRGGYSSGSEQGWQERNLAQALVNRGMPSVIAMAERIPDDVAISFTQLLYRNLRKGQAIDLSLNKTRQGLISVYGSHQFYWALPTLYMQPAFNGYLLDAEGDHEQAERLDAIDESLDNLLTRPMPRDANWRIANRQVRNELGNETGVTSAAHRSSYRQEDARSSPSASSSPISSSPTPISSSPTSVDASDQTSAVNSATDTAAVTNQRRLVNNNDASAQDTVVQMLGAPPTAVDIDAEIDGELRVPEDIKTPRGFYGEPVVAPQPSTRSAEARGNPVRIANAVQPQSVQDSSPPARSPSARPYGELPGDRKATPLPTSQLPAINTFSASIPGDSSPGGSDTGSSGSGGSGTGSASLDSMGSIDADSPAAPTEDELIGERLTRSHTLHTKILTLSGMASIAAILLLGAVTVGLVQRLRDPRPVRSESASEQVSADERSLPFQVELALDQGNLDAATTPAKALIENGEFAAAITALETASNRQQQDVIVLFFKGRAQWGLVKQGSADYAADDAMRSWKTALESEPDWMEIAMALGFAQYAIGREQQALESWEQAIELAERQSNAQTIYFSEQSKDDYMLNAHAGLAIASLALSKIEVDPEQRNQLLAQAIDAYQEVMNKAPADFSPKELGTNWLWLSPAIADWVDTKQELSQLLE